MEQQILNLQSDFIYLQNQYDQLYAQGKELQKKLLSTLQSPPYKPLIKIYNLIETDYCYLAFKMFGETFSIYVECSFNENGRLTDGYLKTYFSERRIEWLPTVPQVIHSVSFDRIGNIDSRFTIDDFAVPYLMNVVASYKKYVADLHLKNKYTILLRQDRP